jgi:hypothetical protein
MYKTKKRNNFDKNIRMKLVCLVIGLVLIGSCTSKDPKMCACLEAGEKFNDYNASILMEVKTPEIVAKYKQLEKEKLEKCIDFQTMSGEEMLKKKATCE